MRLQRNENIFQFNDGFIIRRGNNVYYTDNDFNLIEKYNFENSYITTLAGLVINDENEILNVKTGEIRHFNFQITISEDSQYVMNEDDGDIYDFDNDVWYTNLNVYTTTKRNYLNRENEGDGKYVLFQYHHPYESNIKDNFEKYFFYNSKSILIYDNRVEIYDGELYSVERFEASLKVNGEMSFEEDDEENYAQLLAVFPVEINIINFYPNHMLLDNYILDLEKVDLYRYVGRPVGIFGDTVIMNHTYERKKYKQPKMKIHNGYFEDTVVQDRPFEERINVREGISQNAVDTLRRLFQAAVDFREDDE